MTLLTMLSPSIPAYQANITSAIIGNGVTA